MDPYHGLRWELGRVMETSSESSLICSYTDCRSVTLSISVSDEFGAI